MKKKFINILIPFLFLAAIARGESKEIELHWLPLQKQTVTSGRTFYWFTFDNAVFRSSWGALPLCQTETGFAEGSLIDVKVIPLEEEAVDAESAALMADADLLQNNYVSFVNNENGKAQIEVVCLRTENGTVYRLKKFLLDYELLNEPLNPNSIVAKRVYKDSSVLKSGRWYKMGITKTGIYRIGYDDLLAMGWNPWEINPDNIKIYGNYTGMLPEANNKSRPDDLRENAIALEGTGDGSFDEDDAILFFARAPVIWQYNPFTGRYDHYNNIYTDTTWYFITVSAGAGKRIQTENSLNATPVETVSEYYDFAVHEKDIENLISSGKEWYGEELSGDTMQRNFLFEVPGLRTDRPVFLHFDIVARSSQNTYYKVFANDKLVIDSTKFNKITPNTSVFARKSNRSVTFFAGNENLDFSVRYYAEQANSVAWINYIELNFVRDMTFRGGQMRFGNPRVAAAGNIVRYKMQNAGPEVKIWDITRFDNPVNIGYELNGSELQFTVPNDSIREFFAFDGTEFLSPVVFRQVENQNLHGISRADYIIVAPQEFKEQAERLGQLHRDYDGMIPLVVEPGQIYNEFSSGSQDPTAIRDFIRMLYDNNVFDGKPGYLLLFGDASFDYRNRLPHNTNLVPTYESDESLRETGSFVTDDYFGLLDNNEGAGVSGNLDIGIGRFPVSKTEDAVAAVDKIEHYMKHIPALMRDWRNTICFVADDGDQNLHMHQAQQLFSIVDTAYPYLNPNKIFSDAFTKVKIPDGYRYPEVNERINRQVEKGALIMNYTGHGGLIGWSDEVILDIPAIRSYDNFDNLPLFITATCEFSRFDNPEFVSAGEYTFLNPRGGAIALLTTTRLAYAHANIVVNMRIYHHLTERENETVSRFGDMIRLSKIPSSQNFLNFTLLGDPALRLVIPENNVVTTKINEMPVASGNDTIHALSKVTVEGEIHDDNGYKVTGFNGYLYPKVFDKPTKYTTLGNPGGISIPEDFYLQDKILFNGKVTVTDGKFSFTFVVPKDISYQYGFGKISYYALDTVVFEDAKGYYRQLLIGGIEKDAEPDTEGPEIKLFVDNRHFVNGGKTSSNPVIIADIFDEQGVNATGSSLGRDLVLWIDDDKSTQLAVNDYFELQNDSYQKGTLTYQLHNLSEGFHKVTVKAWDVQNNSSEQSVEFEVTKSGTLILSEVKNMPNPFSATTAFTFHHNKPGQMLNYRISVYTLSGLPVKTLEGTIPATGTEIQPIVWDGRGDNNVRIIDGIYLYRLVVSDSEGNRAVTNSKLMRLTQ